MNPYDVDRVAETIDTALKMDEDERRLRMKQLRRRECDNDVDHWMANFLAEMDCIECTITGVLPQYDRLQHPVKVTQIPKIYIIETNSYHLYELIKMR